MKIYFLFTISLIIIAAGCNNKKDEIIKLKEKELDLKQQEIDLEKKKLESEKQNNEVQSNQYIKIINLNGNWSGTIKDGTYWTVEIQNFDGKNFDGINRIYWNKSPEGLKTNFSGILNSSNEVTMYEDDKVKGAGKFKGLLSQDGNNMSGEWYRYSDNGSFTWSLKR